ncbi:MAG: DUF4238 domain-containing protein [Chitinophagaceae bacterium]|nr:DUF4238 domain-containing protein [Chitinophagaceae bacterium]
MASHTSELAKEVLADLEKRAKLFSTYSSRHHYIPQHYIKGFTGEDGLLSVYDKKTDTIKTKRFAPKGVFYESDRNSFQVDDINISILEDYMFAKYDTEFAKCIRDLRNSPNTEELLSIENQAMLSAFIVDLFWRNPLTDYAFEDLLARSVITFTDTQTGKAYTDIEKER